MFSDLNRVFHKFSVHQQLMRQRGVLSDQNLSKQHRKEEFLAIFGIPN